MDGLISRQAAIDALTEYGNGRAVFISVGEAVIRIENLPSAQPATNCSEFPNNSDTISREAVADAINGIECTRHTTWYEFYQKVMTAVEKLPSAQPDIVRCKDCKHYRHGLCMKASMCVNKSENGFCDWAERREVTT